MNKSAAVICLVSFFAIFGGSWTMMNAESSLVPPPKKEGAVPQFSPSRIAGTWIWNATEKIYPGTIDFAGDGTGSHGARNNLTWEITGEREITITHATRGAAVIRFDRAFASFRGTDYYGKTVSGRRFRR